MTGQRACCVAVCRARVVGHAPLTEGLTSLEKILQNTIPMIRACTGEIHQMLVRSHAPTHRLADEMPRICAMLEFMV